MLSLPTSPAAAKPADRAYRLIDFGGGRKLESLAGYRINRPSPAAESAIRHSPVEWKAVDARFDERRRCWSFNRPWPNDLAIAYASFELPVQPTPYGHIGLFPEQQDNWDWLAADHCGPGEIRPALNLFAYTGASTLALLAGGYQVAHVDAAKPNVEGLRAALQWNRWTDRPVRLLVDDAAKFAAREVRRQRRYHTIVLDPPAYGHSPRGRAWRLERDLWPLLDDCLRLVDPAAFRILLTGHSPQIEPAQVIDYVWAASPIANRSKATGLRFDSGRSQLIDSAGRALDAGFYLRIRT